MVIIKTIVLLAAAINTVRAIHGLLDNKPAQAGLSAGVAVLCLYVALAT